MGRLNIVSAELIGEVVHLRIKDSLNPEEEMIKVRITGDSFIETWNDLHKVKIEG